MLAESTTYSPELTTESSMFALIVSVIELIAPDTPMAPASPTDPVAPATARDPAPAWIADSSVAVTVTP